VGEIVAAKPACRVMGRAWLPGGKYCV